LADPLTRTYAAKVTFVDADPAVRLGMTASVRASRRLALPAIHLPLTALIEQDGQPAVWVVDPKNLKVLRRRVELGPFHEDQATIARGLAPGERVVTAGVHKLYPEQSVRLLDD
ncbi:MAG TPA: efflux transporter periplasmic adaptor subunit, partial [Candidatus Competibacteraceae bacterium]|nr:efflux transporter periplasmic adaptor subunit [Candidatus Competibacteraceae bacterium]